MKEIESRRSSMSVHGESVQDESEGLLDKKEVSVCPSGPQPNGKRRS
jgi:hypothetical protein